MRVDWTALPKTVTTGIADRVGGATVTPAPTGDHAEIAATVTGEGGTIFVKAAASDLGVRSLRRELLVGEVLHPPRSPAVQWHFAVDGWLVVGFEHLVGPHPDLCPGSPDLDLLSTALKDLAEAPTPGMPLFTPADRLGFSVPTMNGRGLVHTDLNPANLIVTADGLHIVDWAYATEAAPWVELALLPQWLIGCGHTPAQAEEWLAQHPAWSAVAPEVLDHFAAENSAKWQLKAQASDVRWVLDLADWTGRWSTYRLR